jgi:hypothetical protein
MERHVLHRHIRVVGFPAESDAFDFNKVRHGHQNQSRIVGKIVCVYAFDLIQDSYSLVLNNNSINKKYNGEPRCAREKLYLSLSLGDQSESKNSTYFL